LLATASIPLSIRHVRPMEQRNARAMALVVCARVIAPERLVLLELDALAVFAASRTIPAAVVPIAAALASAAHAQH